MPDGMVLKSEGFASTSVASRIHAEGVLRRNRLPYQDSGLLVPLQTFCDYGLSFYKRYVPWSDTRSVVNLDGAMGSFRLALDDGTTVTAARVVFATGIGSFACIPPELRALGADLCTHSTRHRALDEFAGKEVLVIGGGASGVELAGLMSRLGIKVTLAARQDPIPFCGPPRQRSLLEKLKAPESGLGTGWRSMACVMAPMLFHAMPQSFRHMIVRRHLGPAPGGPRGRMSRPT